MAKNISFRRQLLENYVWIWILSEMKESNPFPLEAERGA